VIRKQDIYRGGTRLHLTEIQLRQLADDQLPAEERKTAVRHLLARCRPCLDLARKVLFPEMESEPDYSGVLRRLDLSLVLARNDVDVERGVARALWDGHLSALEPGPRLMAIRNNPDLQTWGAFDLLLAEAKRITLERPIEAVDLVYAALAVTDLLDTSAYGDERINDFKANSWAVLANAKRLAGDFQGAGEALRTAAGMVDLGTGDPYEEANVLSMTASLLTDLGEFERAAEVLQDAVALARSVRDRPLEGRLRIKQSSAIGWADPAQGLRLAELGLKLLRRPKSEDKHTELGALHLTALWANELGEFEEARSTLETYRYLYATFPDPWTQGHLLLLDGLICRNEARLEDSERLLRRLVEHDSEHGMAFDLTLATLEWAEALVLLGRYRDATDVLQEVYPLIEQWGAHIDILRAWKIVEESVQRRVVQHETFRELAMTVRRRWYRRGG
jgi:tetratricopeptide (TPR) repeat protein